MGTELPHFRSRFNLFNHFDLLFMSSTRPIPLRVRVRPLACLVIVNSWAIERMHRRHLDWWLLYFCLDLFFLNDCLLLTILLYLHHVAFSFCSCLFPLLPLAFHHHLFLLFNGVHERLSLLHLLHLHALDCLFMA